MYRRIRRNPSTAFSLYFSIGQKQDFLSRGLGLSRLSPRSVLLLRRGLRRRPAPQQVFCICLRWRFSEKRGECIDKCYACSHQEGKHLFFRLSEKTPSVTTSHMLALNVNARERAYRFFKIVTLSIHRRCLLSTGTKIRFDDFFKRKKFYCF